MAPSQPPKPNPLPRGPVMAICIMYFTNALAPTILFPFLPLMVASFAVTDDPTKLGYYAGYLGSSYFVGSLLTSSFWGILSDQWGRKPVLLIGLATNMVCGGAFGLCTSFHWAMLVRFLHGLFSTVAATGRSTVAELCDSTNQAQGFALLGTNFGLGLLIGPALGGFLCEPAVKYPWLFPPRSLFGRFPFLLPCLLLALLSLLGLLATAALLPETKGGRALWSTSTMTFNPIAIVGASMMAATVAVMPPLPCCGRPRGGRTLWWTEIVICMVISIVISRNVVVTRAER
ncbi:hypothetical protein CLOP_g8449 [Closterium sp. NIES-67]|nr:hypothetical protein CLOP_g8449 [Closterium sp. NIES-67]